MVFTSLALIITVQEGKKSEKKKTILTRDNHGHQLYLVF